MATRKRCIYSLFLLLYLLFLAYFYYTYVPLIKSYQLILLPLLAFLVLLTAIRLELGFLFFLFLLPLANNLPYYFGLYENIPQAKVGLILFLFFLLGYLLQAIISYRIGYLKERESNLTKIKHPLQPFLGIFIALAFVSGLITFFRYSNFFPFLSDTLPELIVNSMGVRAGGARMSALFSSLNMAAGPILSLLLFPYLIKSKFRHQALMVFFTSFFLSLVLGTAQFAFFPNFGQLPNWRLTGQFHATYKDPNSFGFYLSAFLPLGFILLLKIFWFENQKVSNFKKAILMVAILLSCFHLATSGVRSAFLASFLAVTFLFIFYLIQPGLIPKQRILVLMTFGVLLIFLLIPFIFESILNQRLAFSFKNLREASLGHLFTGKLTLWSIAWKMFNDFPLSGVGTGAYIVELPNYAQMSHLTIEGTDSAENIFLQVLSELGIFGFLVMAIIGIKIMAIIKNALAEIKEIQARFLTLGLSSSLLACLVNFNFHSYIGGFSAKYLFWFLLTSLLAETNLSVQQRDRQLKDVGNKIVHLKTESESEKEIRTKEITIIRTELEKDQQKASPSSRTQTLGRKKSSHLLSLVISLILIIFGGANLVISWKYLSIPQRTEKFGWDQDYGFYSWEKDNRGLDFRWAKKEAGLKVKILGPTIGLLIHTSQPDIERNPVKLRIYLVDKWFKKKKLIYVFEFKDRGWHRFELPVNEVIDNYIFNTLAYFPIINLRFEASRDWHPGRTLGIPDPRKIAFALGPIFFIYPTFIPEESFVITKSFPNTQWIGDQGALLATSGQATVSFTVDEANCGVRLKVRGDKAFDLGPFIKIYIDQQLVGQTLLETKNWTYLYLSYPLKVGEHTLTVEYTNDFYAPSLHQDRNLHLGEVDIFKIISLPLKEKR